LKILHHPANNTYRMLLRREQIFKCVLNQYISPDVNMSPMENSTKAFCWAGMNYAEGIAVAEQLALRFKNEELANKFQTTVNECLKKFEESRQNLKPEND
jgi:E3 SUMO-protein ligase RanBP2